MKTMTKGLAVLLALVLVGACGGGSAGEDAGDKTGASKGDAGQPGASDEPGFEISLGKEAIAFTNAGTPVEVPVEVTAVNGFKLDGLDIQVEGLPEYVEWEAGQPEVSPDSAEATAVLSFELATDTAPRANHDVSVSVRSGAVSEETGLTVQVTSTSCG